MPRLRAFLWFLLLLFLVGGTTVAADLPTPTGSLANQEQPVPADPPTDPAPQEPPTTDDEEELSEARLAENRASFLALVQHVQQQYYRRRMLDDLGWDRLIARYRPGIEHARDVRTRYRLMNELLGELGSAHATIIAPEVFRAAWGHGDGASEPPQLGFRIVREMGRLFAMAILDGGPAEQAGIVLGDEIVQIDGVDTMDSPLVWEWANDHAIGRPLQYIAVPTSTEPVSVTLRREDGGETRTVEVVPAGLSTVAATRNSIRTVAVGEATVGVIHLWDMGGPEIARILDEALAQSFADVDGIVIDLRGRGGQLPVLLSCFSHFGHAGPRNFPRMSRRTNLWPADKPAIALIDEHARSAKEYFAYYWKRDGVGPLIGRTTAGAGVSCTIFPLPDGAWVMLPIRELTGYTDGFVIERQGIEPDIAVQARYPFAAGEDPILGAGLELMDALLAEPEPVFAQPVAPWLPSEAFELLPVALE